MCTFSLFTRRKPKSLLACSGKQSFRSVHRLHGRPRVSFVNFVFCITVAQNTELRREIPGTCIVHDLVDRTDYDIENTFCTKFTVTPDYLYQMV